MVNKLSGVEYNKIMLLATIANRFNRSTYWVISKVFKSFHLNEFLDVPMFCKLGHPLYLGFP